MSTTTAPPLLIDEGAHALAGVRVARREREAAERTQVFRVLEWAVVNQAEAAGRSVEDFGERALAVAGLGAPRVAEFAAFELAAALGMSSESGTRYLGNAVEVRYRLPRLWARLAAGELTVWRAFRIAEQTRRLDADAALAVDQDLAPFAHKVGAAQIDRTVTDAMAAADPDAAADLAAAARDFRRFNVLFGGVDEADQRGLHGMKGIVEVHGVLDVRDALDLDAAVGRVAAQLADLGSKDTLDVRRSVAAGEIARAQDALDLANGDDPSAGTEKKSGGGVTIVAHLRPGTPLADLDTPCAAGMRVWWGQVKDWCQTAGTSVTVVPVIDLAADLRTTAYTPTRAMKSLVDLRDRTCVFPFCTRPAWRCDTDHVQPFGQGGPTSTHNLAPLCRRHHRAKTHSRWDYDVIEPGVYQWCSPHGLSFRVDPSGTLATDPDPPDD